MRRIILILIFCLFGATLSNAQDYSQGYELALQRINDAKRTGATTLDLYNMPLRELPPEIAELTQVRSINLGFNRLTSFPMELTLLPNLEELLLGFNQIRSIPPEIANLQNLTVLNLTANRLTSLPSEIGALQNLEELFLAENQLGTLPAEIGLLDELTVLGLHANQITSLPLEITQLSDLERLDLAQNNLQSLLPEIAKLESLCFLSLRENELQYLPQELENLSGLTERGCSLVLDGNPLISPPAEVIDAGTPTIFDYLHNQTWWHLQKLLVGSASFAGILAVAILGLRWRRSRGKAKRKNEERTV